MWFVYFGYLQFYIITIKFTLSNLNISCPKWTDLERQLFVDVLQRRYNTHFYCTEYIYLLNYLFILYNIIQQFPQ